MGLKIEYRDTHGRKHSNLEKLVEAESDKLVDEAARNIEQIACQQRCAVHGQNASIAIDKDRGGFNYSIDGCCDALVKKADRAVKAVLR